MPKRPTRQQQPEPRESSWAVYRVAAKLRYVSIVNAPDGSTAIARVAAEYNASPNERLKLIALRCG